MECETIERYDENMQPIMRPKKAFETLEEAIRRAKKVNSRNHIIHKVIAYKCSKCHKFHIGRNGNELKEKERLKFKKATI